GIDTQPREQPIGDKGADDADGDVANQAESGAAYDLRGNPASNQTDDQSDNDTLAAEWHVDVSLVVRPRSSRIAVHLPHPRAILNAASISAISRTFNDVRYRAAIRGTADIAVHHAAAG